jgi:hypothetical protein
MGPTMGATACDEVKGTLTFTGVGIRSRMQIAVKGERPLYFLYFARSLRVTRLMVGPVRGSR